MAKLYINVGLFLTRKTMGLDQITGNLFDNIGTDTKEIRFSDAAGIYRVMYEHKLGVYHCIRRCPPSKRATWRGGWNFTLLSNTVVG